ncbi:DnaJ C-terminal domain-containing protein [Nesterenkonia marinintestina]|uniref:DnaJ C-terminal domain-containing protein n=1 Tax=Nesterenkonia marinintestina TaxID=2979865 RepID=UPI0021C18037|nr:DnaJ C-terminal domain-containing protein [Nesterenkonia sp. GX14115]
MASQDWLNKDFYAILGVSKDADQAEIKKAYRKLARKYHPDTNSGDEKAEKRFKDVGEAYTVLSDAEQREQYDAIRAMGSGARFSGAPAGGGGGAAGFEDLFGGLFNTGGGGYTRTRRGTPPGTAGGAGGFPAGFEDIFGNMGGGGFGGRFGGGAPAKGADRSAETTISFAGSISGTQVGLREPDGHVIDVKVPAGIRDGQKVRVKGKGQSSPGGDGDLMVTVKVTPHRFFERDGDDIRVHLPVSFDEAVLGATVSVPTVHGEQKRIKVPAGSSTGKVLRLKEQGVRRKNRTPGDMLVVLDVQVPAELSDEAREAVEAYAAATAGQDPRDGLEQRARL